MADEVFNNQRPAIIAAVLLAALLAAGLWYFFVFRSADLPQVVEETPTATPEIGRGVASVITPVPTPLPVQQGQVAAAQLTPTPANVAASAQTGPAHTTTVVTVALTAIGLLGARHAWRRPRAI